MELTRPASQASRGVLTKVGALVVGFFVGVYNTEVAKYRFVSQYCKHARPSMEFNRSANKP
jgi:hypothetical protein